MDVLCRLDELEHLVDKGTAHVFGKVVVDEQAFKSGIVKLKKAFPHDLIEAERALRYKARVANSEQAQEACRAACLDSFRLVEELDHLLADGRLHIFGKVSIDAQAFFLTTAKLKQALSDDLAISQDVTVVQNKTPDVATELERAAQQQLDEARAQADHIIEEARREAERIKAEAKSEARCIIAAARRSMPRAGHDRTGDR
jgi:hypothetical protein